jgi:alginate O-acetyltransferase complex protein AlgI
MEFIMSFSSVGFLFFFLPAVIILYFIIPDKIKNLFLLLVSLFFCFYAGLNSLIILLSASVSGYLHGIWIFKTRKSRYAVLSLISSIVVSVGMLIYFNYFNFFIENINLLFNTDISFIKLILPVGISLYTLRILSYTIDIYRGNAEVQKNIFKFITNISLFPLLTSGLAIKYIQAENELKNDLIQSPTQPVELTGLLSDCQRKCFWQII